MKSTAERSIEALTWAGVVIWLGFTLIAQLLNYPWLVVMVLSIILLSSAIYQHSQGWQTSLAIWVFGIWMAVFSVMETVSAIISAITGGSGLPIGIGVYMGIALVSMGVAVVFRTVQFSGGRGPLQQQRPTGRGNNTSVSPASYAPPRRVQDEGSSAYTTPPVDPRARSGRGRAPADYGPLTTRGQAADPGYDQANDPGYDQGQPGGYTQSNRRGSQTGRQGYAPTGRTQVDAQNYDSGQPGDDQGQLGSYTPPSRRSSAGQTGRQTGYNAPSRAPRAPQQPDYGYDQQPADYQDQASYQPPAPRPSDRRRVSPQRPSQAPPPASSSELESRVEDIIRRSRERRNTPPDDLPY